MKRDFAAREKGDERGDDGWRGGGDAETLTVTQQIAVSDRGKRHLALGKEEKLTGKEKFGRVRITKNGRRPYPCRKKAVPQGGRETREKVSRGGGGGRGGLTKILLSRQAALRFRGKRGDYFSGQEKSGGWTGESSTAHTGDRENKQKEGTSPNSLKVENSKRLLRFPGKIRKNPSGNEW